MIDKESKQRNKNNKRKHLIVKFTIKMYDNRNFKNLSYQFYRNLKIRKYQWI